MSKQLEQQLTKASMGEKKAWEKKWKADPKKNPVDGKRVVKGKGTYIMLVEHLGDPEHEIQKLIRELDESAEMNKKHTTAFVKELLANI